MIKFLGIVASVSIIVSIITLIWPRINPNPRPKPLQDLHNILLGTKVGQNVANVLGVSDEYAVLPLTPQGIAQEIVSNFQGRISDVVITHAVREITKRFKDLPLQDQEKVLEEFSKAVGNPPLSPTENFSQPTQDSAQTND